jgi:hypothetical protein
VTRCPECSEAAGHDVDHTPSLRLPPVLVRFEHFLSTKGLLARPVGVIDPTLPTRAGSVPSRPMSFKHRRTAMGTIVSVLKELGYLERKGGGRWVSVAGTDPREVSVRELQDYLLRRFPVDPCQKHREGCVRCCLPHHLSMYNKVCEAFRKMAEWLYFEERVNGRPVWSKDKLIAVYAIARRRKYKLRPPQMNEVESLFRFQEWLEARDKAYGYMLWFLQEFGARYEEMAHAEYPPDGPFVRLNSPAGVVEITGKGQEGGKTRVVTLTPVRTAKLQEILAWRAKLEGELEAWSGRKPAPVLFPVVSKTKKLTGNARDEDPSVFNRMLQAWARRFNAWCEAEGHADWTIDVGLVSSHKVGRPVYLTYRAKLGIPRKIMKEEAGIEQDEVIERYERFSQRERQEILSRADRHNVGAEPPPAQAVTNGAVLEELRALRAELHEKDKRIQELTDRLLGLTKAVDA